jgi:hypothetical protein
VLTKVRQVQRVACGKRVRWIGRHPPHAHRLGSRLGQRERIQQVVVQAGAALDLRDLAVEV